MIVNVREGKLEGTTNKSVLTGKKYYYFLGIRYAKPPIEDLRFQVTGASHADELPYLFYSNRFCKNIFEIKEPEKTVINNMCAMWTNFAKTGNPTDGMKDVEWKPSTFDNPRYLQINKDLTLKEGKIFEKRFSFLKKIYEFATEYPPK
ncbi:hypothetical protein PGB90_005497 [Kerria lacca]